ncbi:MAG: HNH endonuclease [Tepidibacter sp.]|jgi:predicted HNH restriction endonuclease|uniref:HNH endonuclease n=1 Tax=Tepidibacter sp. TaxID=2529387 RepID=UPI0025E55E54|nr:HNH endonuclease signature motif containing protein [Tepidibacter sp.]MCT4510004.1 HNH endonuclease [Tepidibacter sp.]
MGKLIIPKHSADVEECMYALQVYYENKDLWIKNDKYKERLKELIGDHHDKSAYTKKAQVPAYYGFIEWEKFGNKRSPRRITEKGIEFFEAYQSNDYDRQIEIIIDSLENIKFGRENYGSCDSDSDIEPPNLKIRAILDLDYITVQEFACLLCLMSEHEYNYVQGINYIRTSRKMHNLEMPSGVKSDYTDPKSILILERWGILESVEKKDNSKAYKISSSIKTKFYNRLVNLDIYNSKIASINSSIKDRLVQEDIEGLEQNYIISLDKTEDLSSDKVKKDTINNRKPEEISTKQGRRYKTDDRVVKTAISECEYKCCYDKDHPLFKRKNGTNYVEGHHIIPMAAQKNFKINIDRTENVVALCPFCHKAIHLGEDEIVKDILYKIFTSRKSILSNIGIDITFEELLSNYY